MDNIDVLELRDKKRGEFPPKNTARGFAEYATFIKEMSDGKADLPAMLIEASRLNRSWVDFGCGDGRALRSFVVLGSKMLDIQPPHIIGITANITSEVNIPGGVIVPTVIDESNRLRDVINRAQASVNSSGVHLITGINSFYYLDARAWALSLRDTYDVLSDGGAAFLDIYTQRDVFDRKYESLPNMDISTVQTIAQKVIPTDVSFSSYHQEHGDEKVSLLSLHFKK